MCVSKKSLCEKRNGRVTFPQERGTGAGGALCRPTSVEGVGFLWLCLLSLLTCQVQEDVLGGSDSRSLLGLSYPFSLVLLLLRSPPSSAWAGAVSSQWCRSWSAWEQAGWGREGHWPGITGHVWNLPQGRW